MERHTVRMMLLDEPYELMKSGKKVIEVRCNDEKRRGINVGDVILFVRVDGGEGAIHAVVTELYKYPTFLRLYESRPTAEFGMPNSTPSELADEIRRIYDAEKEAKYGALGIRVKVTATED